MPGDLSQVYVLIVEDEPLNATLITAMLGITGIVHTYVAPTALEIASFVARMARVDLVLLDLNLPDMDGFQALGHMREQEVFHKVPIVAVTASITMDTVARAELTGFDGFIGKPLHFDRFPSQIRRILAGERVWEPR